MARRIESLSIAGPAGRLEALLEEPDGAEPREAALVCHPHPLFGGTLHNKVVYRMARGLRRSGAVVLRFNFRGVGASEGEHGNLTGEIEDARAALSWLRERYPELPFSLAGFSFGARVITSLGCGINGPLRLLAAGFPTRHGPAAYLENCAIPKVFIQSTHDEFGPRGDMEAMYAKFAEPKRLVWVEAAGHFFDGALDAFEEQVFQTVSNAASSQR
ncbi:MAG TPA: alpha/beta family hydrolase [Bryobacteraceae bacterium]|nr:alpha/beta family hydrolase [Bryobacteraceae bacterium]